MQRMGGKVVMPNPSLPEVMVLLCLSASVSMVVVMGRRG